MDSSGYRKSDWSEIMDSLVDWIKEQWCIFAHGRFHEDLWMDDCITYDRDVYIWCHKCREWRLL